MSYQFDKALSRPVTLYRYPFSAGLAATGNTRERPFAPATEACAFRRSATIRRRTPSYER